MLSIDVSAPLTRTFTLLFGNLTTTDILFLTLSNSWRPRTSNLILSP
uniref:Aminophospholipid ATPase n=1 Tax=Arundo donax TaxID=35708 RepID=A0A0A9BBY0_ARUDO